VTAVSHIDRSAMRHVVLTFVGVPVEATVYDTYLLSMFKEPLSKKLWKMS
jgi:hypothetical protein